MAKFLAINASPRPTGQTAQLLNRFTKRALELNSQVDKIDLYQQKFEPFSGELNKERPLSKLNKALIESDGFVIATPTYWFNMPALLKNFIDHLTPLEEDGWKLEGKVAGIIVYSPEGGDVAVLQNLSITLNQMGVIVPPYGLIFYRGEMDRWALKDCEDLADRMISLAEVLKKSKIDWL